jgi:hypothetical protein
MIGVDRDGEHVAHEHVEKRERVLPLLGQRRAQQSFRFRARREPPGNRHGGQSLEVLDDHLERARA